MRRGTLLCWMPAACAALVAGDAAGATLGEGAHRDFIERVNRSQTSEYVAGLAAFDAHLAAHPEDSIVLVERCRFIDHFAHLEEEPIERAAQDQEACLESVKSQAHAASPAAKLYMLDRLWGEEGATEGERLLAESGRWTQMQRATLLEHLSSFYGSAKLLKAGPYALEAVRLNPASGARLTAAEYLLRIGSKAAAARMIEEMPRERWETWTLDAAVKLLLTLEQPEKARRLVADHEAVVDDGTRLSVARALFQAGKVEWARALLAARKPDAGEEFVPTNVLRESFELEREYGSTAGALAAYRNLRKEGLSADPFGWYRLSLLASHPGAAWKWADLAGIAVLLGAFAFVAVLPLVVVAPLHYRSVVKTVRGRPPAPRSSSAPWSLRQMWYALAALLLGGMAGSYALDYPSFHTAFAEAFGFTDYYATLSRDTDLGRALLVSTIVCTLALLPVLRGVLWRELLLGHWTLRKSLGSGALMAVGLIIVGAGFRNVVPGSIGTETTRAMQGLHAAYGTAALLITVAVLVPVLEELVFRGVVLRTVARHAAVWVAVLLQALLFMLVHEDPNDYPYLVLFALVAAWLALRSGGLLAPMALHATNNAFAAMTLITVSRFT